MFRHPAPTGQKERKMTKNQSINRRGIRMLRTATVCTIKDSTDLRFHEIVGRLTIEDDGNYEISARLTISGRPEIISADNSWFDIIAK